MRERKGSTNKWFKGIVVNGAHSLRVANWLGTGGHTACLSLMRVTRIHFICSFQRHLFDCWSNVLPTVTGDHDSFPRKVPSWLSWTGTTVPGGIIELGLDAVEADGRGICRLSHRSTSSTAWSYLPAPSDTLQDALHYRVPRRIKWPIRALLLEA